MSRFIKLTNKIINTTQILKIDIWNNPKAYYITLKPIYVSGYHFFSFGSISSHDSTISIYEECDKDDYKIITDWIDKIKNDE